MGGAHLKPWSLPKKQSLTGNSCLGCSRFALYLQKFLGRASPVHIHLQAATQKFTQARGQPELVQIWYPLLAYQVVSLKQKET